MAANTTCPFIGFFCALPFITFFILRFIEKKNISRISQEINLIVQKNSSIYQFICSPYEWLSARNTLIHVHLFDILFNVL